MPKLYEYFGLVFFFYSNDHRPIHVHVEKGGTSAIVEIWLKEGIVVEVRFRKQQGKRMLGAADQRSADTFVRAMAKDIVRKWTARFVEGISIKPERITRRIK